VAERLVTTEPEPSAMGEVAHHDGPSG